MLSSFNSDTTSPLLAPLYILSYHTFCKPLKKMALWRLNAGPVGGFQNSDMAKFPELFNTIDWHDLPVDQISINSEEKSLSFRIASYNEELEEYNYFNLRFLEIESINTSEGDLNDLLSFDSEYSLEFNYCDYSLDEDGTYHFEFLILLGSRRPVIKF